MSTIKSLTGLIVSLVFLGCEKTTETPMDSSTLAPLSIEFDNIVGGYNLQLGTGVYKNDAGEEYTVDLLQYFISNVSFTKADGTVYTVPQDSSYFLIREGQAADRFANMKVPVGDYKSVRFTLGVDSVRSTLGIDKRKGVLDPSGGMESGMYWGWNSGYIFLKMEGTSASVPVDPSGQRKFRYHIGGFGGYNVQNINNIKVIDIDLQAGGVAKVRTGRAANIHLLVDIAKVFNGTTTVSLATHPSVMFSEYSRLVANNYQYMFVHDHTEN
ncbi:MbnP family protein [Flavihumibacter sp. CACIAM 22H1]|uniref:MbnP family protein n=1 Tax=Flavihumibacter sp. CACIAM 22H1 TaxID=1812911 RepID=UPI0007A86846|nr:MbnP family protein [Flavihumibacter sp. CACIAM 22H1]KYP16616.1 MAG: hypothetical protein A1D16_09390 [Flavihumibacter sp. CACIAM 22H1]